MPAGRPRGGNSGFRGHPAPMSERQQLALLLQMTSQESQESGGSSPSRIGSQSTSSEQHRASRSRCRNERGETPLHVAAIRGDEGQVRRLIARGADPNAKDFAGWTPLHEACNHGWLGAARILIEAGASVNAVGLDDDTPLHDASVNGHQELVKLLVANGGDPTLKNKRGKTAVDVAAASLDHSCFARGNETQDTPPDQSTPSADRTDLTTTTTTVDGLSGGKSELIAPSSSIDPGGTEQLQQPTGSPSTTPPISADCGAPCEMRRTPPQNKVDRSGTGQSGSSPRVTLRLNQVRSTRDEKKGGGTPRHGLNTQSQNMETSKTSSASSGGTANSTSGSNNNGNTSGDSGDVYEFKSSKEATPVRGASTSPNPPDKEKDTGKCAVGTGSSAPASGTSSAVSSEAVTASTTDDAPISSSPSTKRSLESDTAEEQDEENRRKKRKDSESTKETAKATASGRQSTGRNSTASEKCTKSGKQGANNTSGKNNQTSTASTADRKSPSSSTASGSSPKPSTTSGSTNSKTATPAPPESDGEDDRSKSSDSNSAPKVPPLKIVIPQSTTSEQEQGNRNGKSTSNRSHQLPYVVASSNSNDSTDKDQTQSVSGTTSPTEGASSKNDEKKDFTGALHGEERSTHHQRVLRSSHRSGNGGNGSTSSKEASGSSSGNGNYSNSSPLPATSSTDRSNNSSPQQRHHSPTPETTSSEPNKTTPTESTSSAHSVTKATTTVEKSEKTAETNGKERNQKEAENSESASSTQSTTTSNAPTPAPAVELHPRKRKMKPSKEAQQAAASAAASEASDTANTGPEVHPHDQPITNCYQLFLNIRKQIERRRKGLFPVQPKPPQGFKDYLMNRCTYVLAGNANKEPNVNPPVALQGPMKDLYVEQEKERYRLRMQHVVEKEKLVLSVEQEILRVHGRAARALANQSLPFSVCTILKDEEVYNVITPEQEEKDRNARSRYNGRLFLSWLQDVDDKWEKIKEAMLLRHHNEAESLHAVQRMDWEWKLKEVGLCEFKARPQIEDLHVPMVHVSDDFDLLPA